MKCPEAQSMNTVEYFIWYILYTSVQLRKLIIRTDGLVAYEVGMGDILSFAIYIKISPHDKN